MLSGGPPDALELLKKDHRKVDGLFSKAKANEDGNNAPVFKRINAELDTHAHIEEKIFYPYILERGDQELNRIVREGIEEHKQIKMFLADLAGLSGTSEQFRAKLKVLMEDVEHHVQEEEDEMFPMIRDQIGDAALQKLGQRLEKEKMRYKERTATSKRPSAAKQRAAASA
jgi:iron-sulfur cluster repair protein YtfE (RIC family)